MKRLQLPKNKFARLGISIICVGLVFWLTYEIIGYIYYPFCKSVNFDYSSFFCLGTKYFYKNWFLLIHTFIFSFIPLRYIWFGRIKPRPRITRSKD